MKFKVGDWVRYKIEQEPLGKVIGNGTDNFTQINIGNSSLFVPNEYIELWNPKEGEWCWFWNTNEMPILEQFNKYYDLDDELGNYETKTFRLYQYCEPFIGELPSFLKDNL